MTDSRGIGMHPEELWNDLRRAFNWPPYPLIKNYKRARISQPRLWVNIGVENISKMRRSLLELSRMGATVAKNDSSDSNIGIVEAKTGYYFRVGSPTRNSPFGQLTINYYDTDTEMVTICNPSPYPSSAEAELLEDSIAGWTDDGNPPDVFFLNKFLATSLGMKPGSHSRILGQTYMEQLPSSSPFINWIGSKPLSSRK